MRSSGQPPLLYCALAFGPRDATATPLDIRRNPFPANDFRAPGKIANLIAVKASSAALMRLFPIHASGASGRPASA